MGTVCVNAPGGSESGTGSAPFGVEPISSWTSAPSLVLPAIVSVPVASLLRQRALKTADSSESVGALNVAVTVLAASSLTVHVAAAPEQAPPQPTKNESLLGASVSVTVVFLRKSAAQVAPQPIPAGALVTVPFPDRVTVSRLRTARKLAVTDLSALIVSVQVAAVPEQAPLQPANALVSSGVAVSVTLAPSTKTLLQIEPQSSPAG
jgi:hypothetical protein